MSEILDDLKRYERINAMLAVRDNCRSLEEKKVMRYEIISLLKLRKK